MKVGFNIPQEDNTKLKADVAFYPGGLTCQKLTTDLEAKYKDCCILDKAKMAADTPEIKSPNDFFEFYAQIKIKMTADQTQLG